MQAVEFHVRVSSAGEYSAFFVSSHVAKRTGRDVGLLLGYPLSQVALLL